MSFYRGKLIHYEFLQRKINKFSSISCKFIFLVNYYLKFLALV